MLYEESILAYPEQAWLDSELAVEPSLPAYATGRVTLISSYHCSRYNTNTGVLTAKMFDEVVKRAKIAAMPQI